MHKGLLHFAFAVGLLVLALVFALALWKGDRSQKLGAAFNLAAGLLAIIHRKSLVAPDLQPMFFPGY